MFLKGIGTQDFRVNFYIYSIFFLGFHMIAKNIDEVAKIKKQLQEANRIYCVFEA